MPRGKHLDQQTRDEIKRRLYEGELPQFIAAEYGITRKTCIHYLDRIREEIRASLRAEGGRSDIAIEREVCRRLRGCDCKMWTFEYPGEIKSCYISAPSGRGARYG